MSPAGRTGTRKFSSRAITAHAMRAVLLATSLNMRMRWRLFGGSFASARPRAAGVFDYAMPQEGILTLLDNLAILKDALHVEETHAFIDFCQPVAVMRPDYVGASGSQGPALTPHGWAWPRVVTVFSMTLSGSSMRWYDH
jgi:spermidine/putrescine-binding protein